MTAKELMIGDWVQNPLGAPYQVLAIHFYKINGDGDGYYGIHLKNKGAEARLEIYDLHPVPLTPKILKKNGFVKTNDGWECDENDVVTIALHSEESCDMWIAEASYEWKHLRYKLPSPKCVHELQHALRLCGIEKEIVL